MYLYSALADTADGCTVPPAIGRIAPPGVPAVLRTTVVSPSWSRATTAYAALLTLRWLTAGKDRHQGLRAGEPPTALCGD